MMRAFLLTSLIFLGAVGSAYGQAKSEVKPIEQADPREELRYDGKPFSYWKGYLLTELKPENRVETLRAMAAFGSRGYAKEATAAIVELLKDYENYEDGKPFNGDATPDRLVIAESYRALQKIGPESVPVVLSHLDRKMVRQLAYALRENTDKFTSKAIAESSVPILVRWIQLKNDDARGMAIAILAPIRTSDFLETKSPYYALFRDYVTKDKNEIAIIKALVQELEEGRYPGSAANLLGLLGPRSKSVVPALVRAEICPAGLKEATEALAQIKPSPAERIPTLLVALKDANAALRANAAEKLGELGSDAREAVADILAEVKNPMQVPQIKNRDDERSLQEMIEQRKKFLAALVKIASPEQSLSVIGELLDKNQLQLMERDLVRAYMNVEKSPARLVPMLTKALQRRLVDKKEGDIKLVQAIADPKEDRELTNELIADLGAQGDAAASAVPVLMTALDRSHDETTKLKIISALGKIGPSARESLQVLGKLVQSPNLSLRQAAARAIEAITKK